MFQVLPQNHLLLAHGLKSRGRHWQVDKVLQLWRSSRLNPFGSFKRFWQSSPGLPGCWEPQSANCLWLSPLDFWGLGLESLELLDPGAVDSVESLAFASNTIEKSVERNQSGIWLGISLRPWLNCLLLSAARCPAHRTPGKSAVMISTRKLPKSVMDFSQFLWPRRTSGLKPNNIGLQEQHRLHRGREE